MKNEQHIIYEFVQKTENIALQKIEQQTRRWRVERWQNNRK
jgi:hypothetical protein